MAITKTVISNPVADTLLVDLECNATAENGAFGGAGVIHILEGRNIDNDHITYVKLVDSNSGATVGSSDPDFVFPFPAGKKTTYVIGAGIAFASDLNFFAVQEIAKTGTTDPTNPVAVKILVT